MPRHSMLKRQFFHKGKILAAENFAFVEEGKSGYLVSEEYFDYQIDHNYNYPPVQKMPQFLKNAIKEYYL